MSLSKKIEKMIRRRPEIAAVIKSLASWSFSGLPALMIRWKPENKISRNAIPPPTPVPIPKNVRMNALSLPLGSAPLPFPTHPIAVHTPPWSKQDLHSGLLTVSLYEVPIYLHVDSPIEGVSCAYTCGRAREKPRIMSVLAKNKDSDRIARFIPIKCSKSYSLLQ